MENILIDSHSSQDDTISSNIENSSNEKLKYFNYFYFLADILLTIETVIIIYFSFIGFISLAVYLLLYEWLSLFTRNTPNLILSIFANFSEFGLFYSFILIVIFVIKIYKNLVIENIKDRIKNFDVIDNLSKKGYFKSHFYINFIYATLILLLALTVCGLLCWGIINKKSRFIMACVMECLFLISSKLNVYFILSKKEEKKEEEKNQNENEPILLPSDETPEDTDTQKKKKKKNNNLNENVDIFNIPIKPPLFFIEHPTCGKIYVWISYLIIILLQAYITIYLPYIDEISVKYIILLVFVKILFISVILKYNFIDIITNFKNRFKSINNKSAKIVHIVVVVFYAVLFVIFILIFLYVKFASFPTAKSARFIENNQIWFKINGNKIVSPEAFCFTQAENDGSLKTEDFAMLTTLPRLYGIRNDGKCYLKPSKRGLFNSTMKYIFGKNYENDGILIMCKKLVNFPVLVITSDKMLNKTLRQFSNDSHIQFFERQFDIKNINYFENCDMKNLPIEGERLLNSYQNCVSEKSAKNCEEEWDRFTQFYWPNMFTNEYVKISGFERYQINIESNLTIQPSFMTSDGQLWSGTHYIVGGGYENEKDVGFLIETIGREHVPSIFKNVLPFYSSISNLDKETIHRLIWFNSKLFFFDVFSSKETKEILELYDQFNFSHKILFTIGHSISGTIFKSASFYSDVQGITFEAADGENNINFVHSSKVASYNNRIVNVFSKGSLLTGFDKNCYVNGMLPKRYKFPNVYDTACMTAITCSETQKYVTFCKQVLNQDEKNPEKEFQISFDAYLNFIGYN